MYHREKADFCIKIAQILKQYGIRTDLESGEISYYRQPVLKVECKDLYFLRHGETEGIVQHCFMSNDSLNSVLTERGICQLVKEAGKIEQLDLDKVLYSVIPRVKRTAEIIYSNMKKKPCFLEIPWVIGIDNTGWEGKRREELKGIDANDFDQRENRHNIFAKSSKGASWGRVLLCCISLIKYLNKNFAGERVLLISQGSILVGLQLILQVDKKPWATYNSNNFFCLEDDGEMNYGRLQKLC